MNAPKTITADFTVDYRPLAVPTILGLGIATAIVSFILIRRKTSYDQEGTVEPPTEETTPEQNPTCPTCGQLTEADWAHCIKCGTKLKNSTQSTTSMQT